MMNKINKQTKLEQIFNKKTLLILLIFLLVYSVIQIMGAIRTIDTVYNFSYLEKELTIKVTDTGSDGISRPLQDYFIIGMNDLIKHIGLAIFLSLFIGYLIGGKEDAKIQNRRK